MPAIGITGGIATGKTAFADCLRETLPNARFFNADEAARTVVNDAEVRKEIRRAFGASVFSAAGDLNRERLRTIVFADATKRRALERILHPRIRRQWRAEAKSHRNSRDFFIADIPLLYETDGESLCDRVVVVACSYKAQLARLTQRMSLNEAEAEQMIKSQMPLDEKIRRADHVVWNNSRRAMLVDQARLLTALWQQESWTKS